MKAFIAAMALFVVGTTVHAGSYITLLVADQPSGVVSYDDSTETLVGRDISISYVTNENTANDDPTPPNPLLKYSFEDATMSFTSGKMLNYKGEGWAFGAGGSFEIKGRIDIPDQANPEEVIYHGTFTDWQTVFAVKGQPGVYNAYLSPASGNYGPGIADAYGTTLGGNYGGAIYVQFGSGFQPSALLNSASVGLNMGGEALGGKVTISTIPGVPEPHSIGLLGIGVVLILRRVRPI